MTMTHTFRRVAVFILCLATAAEGETLSSPSVTMVTHQDMTSDVKNYNTSRVPSLSSVSSTISTSSKRSYGDQTSSPVEFAEFPATTNALTSEYDHLLTGITDVDASGQWRWRGITWNWWVSLQIVSSGLGIIGNLLVVIVIWQRRSANRSTDTLIGALALADFLTSIFVLPFPTAAVVPSTILGELYCRFIYTSYFFWLFVAWSMYTLALISVERLIAVKYPIKFSRFSSRRQTALALSAVWSSMAVVDLFLILTCSVDGARQACQVRFRSPEGQFAVGIVIFLIYFFVPATVMLIAQAVTAYILHIKSKVFLRDESLKNQSNSSYKLLVAKNRVLKMLFVVVLIFIICWGPNNIAYFLYNIGAISPSYLYSDINQMLTLLAFYNSCLNPIVYTIRHPKFRAAIRGLFTGSTVHREALFEYKAETKASSENSNQGVV